MTTVVMLCLVAGMATLLTLRDRRGKDCAFFDQEVSASLRGFWCLVVVLVHTPEAYQNPLQDAVGSFAYIGVTFFFMTSSYGLMQGVLRNGCSAVKGFWRRRLLKLLIPMVLVNIVDLLVDRILMREIQLLSVFSISLFVQSLLLFYFLFWLVFWLPGKMSVVHRQRMLCLLAFAASLVLYIADGRWSVEGLGFLYGILLASYKEQFLKFAEAKWFRKCLITGLVCLVIGVLYIKTKNIVFLGDYVIRAILGCIITLFMLQCLVKYPIGNPASRFLGRISFEIFLLHGITFSAMTQIGVVKESGIYILLSLLITIIVGVAVNFAGNYLGKLSEKLREQYICHSKISAQQKDERETKS